MHFLYIQCATNSIQLAHLYNLDVILLDFAHSHPLRPNYSEVL